MVGLKAHPRAEVGKRVQSLREKGFLPAVLYGEDIPSQPIAVSFRDFEHAYREAGESTLVKLEVEGKAYNVLIHDISHDPLRGQPLHADFYAVRMDKVIRAKVPLEFVGESPAVKTDGGIFVKVVQELEVEALPQDLPHTLPVEISLLDTLESHLAVKDISVPPGVRIIASSDEVVALVERPRSEEELASLAQAPVEAGPQEVKTEREMKKEKEKDVAATEVEGGAIKETLGKIA